MTPSAVMITSRTAEQLHEADKIYRDAFVREYIKDFNGCLALARIGFTGTNAGKRASQLLREPYVAQRLDTLLRQLRPEDVVTRGQVMAKMWKEANDPNNEGSVRVAATAHVAKMLGMDKSATTDTPAVASNVMLIPVTSAEDWSQSAATAQQVLKQRAAAAVMPPPMPAGRN